MVVSRPEREEKPSLYNVSNSSIRKYRISPRVTEGFKMLGLTEGGGGGKIEGGLIKYFQVAMYMSYPRLLIG